MTQQDDPQLSGTQQMVYEKRAPWVIHGIVSILLLVIAVGVVASFFGSKPKANRWGDRPAPSVAVEIAPLEVKSYDVWVDSYGTAEALTRTNLVAEVSGRVTRVSENIRAGSEFKKGELLVELDKRDFMVEVDIAASAAADAQVVYLQEVAQAEFAAQEWNETPTSEAAKQLALRKPQVAAAEASLRAANARLDRAKLNLERTQIVAPFDGKVLQQMVDIGQVVNPTQVIADIYSTEAVEVRLPVKIDDLEHLLLPDSDNLAVDSAKVVLQSDMGSRTYQWQGQIVRTEGAFDPATRMLYVVAQVTDPFIDTTQRPAMRVGQFVTAKLEGKSYDNVYVIPRRAVSQDFKVSVDDQGVLRKRQVYPVWTDSDAVVVSASQMSNVELASSASLNASDRLILTPTANLPEGTKVKPLGQPGVGDRRDARQRPLSAQERDSKEKSGNEKSETAARSAGNSTSMASAN